MMAWMKALLSAGDAPLSLTYKGHGKTHGDPFDSVNNRTLNYGTVLGGSAPVAGDLVCWLVGVPVESNTVADADRFVRLNVGNGWAQANHPSMPALGASWFAEAHSILAKVVDASDISSPLAWFFAGSNTNDFIAAHGFWIAYSITGNVSSVTVPALTTNYGGASAPANVAVDSSALNPPAAAITLAASEGTDGSIQLSGITLDFEETQANWGQYYSSTLDSRFGAKLDVGGASYTLSKGDDGDLNALAGGYVAVS